MIIALVEYINKNGKVTVKGFADEKVLSVFTERLESRGIDYILTRL